MTRAEERIAALVRHDCEVEEGAWISHVAELELTAKRIGHKRYRWEGRRCDGSAITVWDEAVQ